MTMRGDGYFGIVQFLVRVLCCACCAARQARGHCPMDAIRLLCIVCVCIVYYTDTVAVVMNNASDESTQSI